MVFVITATRLFNIFYWSSIGFYRDGGNFSAPAVWFAVTSATAANTYTHKNSKDDDQ